jgi:hypothetical protein
VIGLWALFALPVWSAAYKQAGAQNPEWTGASHVREDIPGLGLVTRAAPEWDGPTFGTIADLIYCAGVLTLISFQIPSTINVLRNCTINLRGFMAEMVLLRRRGSPVCFLFLVEAAHSHRLAPA